MKGIFHFLIFTSLFLALVAAAMYVQTVLLFDLTYSAPLLLFIVAGTLTSYNFHWYLTPRNVTNAGTKLQWSQQHRSIHLILFLVSLIFSAYATWLLKEEWPILLLTASITFIYSAPKIRRWPFSLLSSIAVAKTAFLTLVWTHVTIILPLYLNNEGITTSAIVFTIHRFFYIYAICILFDLRDREWDRRDRIKSLITELNDRGIDVLFNGSVIVSLLLGLTLLAWINALTIIVLVIPLLILMILYPRYRSSQNDYHFYFILDGMMMLSAPFLILAKFAP